MSKKNDLEALRNLEQSANQGESNMIQPLVQRSTAKKTEEPNTLDGYTILDRDKLPLGGVLYPESWNFAYRCPTAKEVANFSTLNERDRPTVMIAIEDLIKKCVVIYDADKEQQVNSGHICDAHRTFFILLLREIYLQNQPIQYSEQLCLSCQKPNEPILTAEGLLYNELNEKLISAFDGRKFTLVYPDLDEPIVFHIPTIENQAKIFRHIVKAFRNGQNDREKKEDKLIYDKQFLLIAPYLYVHGTETVGDLIIKYRALLKDDKRFKLYVELATKFDLDNLEYFEHSCQHCESVEETQIRFPGGWRKMFISSKSAEGYFD